MNDRDCENCKHHKETCRNGIFYHSCESWECEFERKPMTKADAKELLLNIAAYDKRSDKWIEQEVVAEAVHALEQTEGDLDSSSSSEKPNKSEWEHDHEILKAYSDGANEVLDKIKAEIEQAYCKVTNDYDHGRNYGLYIATQIIDRYTKDGE